MANITPLSRAFSFGGNKQLNLIIGFDTLSFNLKIMRVIGKDASTVKVDFIPVPEKHFTLGEWNEILLLGVGDYIKQQNFDKTFAVHLVLPDRVVGTDIVTVPTLARSKMIAGLEAHVKDLYMFYNDYKFNRSVVSANKTNTTFALLMVAKPLLNSVYKALGEHKLYIKNSTFAANATVNAALALRPKNRKQSFLFLDIKSDHACLIAVSNGTTVGWEHIKFGYNVFLNEKVMIENNIVFNDIAQVAVINATERAKKKKMTSMEEEEDDSDLIEENALVLNEIDAHPEEVKTIENNELAGVIEKAEISGGYVTAAPADGEPHGAEGEAREETKATITESKPVPPPPPKVKAYQRKIKKLPAYMQRPVPETQELINVENFRLFVKHVMLMKMQIEQATVYVAPEYALVNMPSDYGYIIDETNKENDGFEFRYFEPQKEDNVELTEHLDLFGALYMEQFNKNNNV